jgi:hypothetical protein
LNIQTLTSRKVITVVGRRGLSPDCALAAVPGASDVPFVRSLRRLCPVKKTNILRAIQDRQQQCDERSMAPAAERDRISRKRNLTEAEERGDERIGME